MNQPSIYAWKSGGSNNIDWPRTRKSGGSIDPPDPVLPRSMFTVIAHRPQFPAIHETHSHDTIRNRFRDALEKSTFQTLHSISTCVTPRTLLNVSFMQTRKRTNQTRSYNIQLLCLECRKITYRLKPSILSYFWSQQRLIQDFLYVECRVVRTYRRMRDDGETVQNSR